MRALLVAALPVLVAACSGPGAAPAPSSCPGANALWAASDYSSSAVGSLAISGSVDAVSPTVDLGAAPALSMSGGRAFYVARDQDAFFALDGCGHPVQRFAAHRADRPGSSDPAAVAVAHDGSLWVPLYLAAAVLVLAPDGSVARTIDLSGDDGDGNPEAAAVAIADTPAGEKAFVALQRLNPYPRSTLPSWMLRIDVATGAVEARIVLAGRNPFSMVLDAGVLWIADAGNFDDAAEPDAGIERFDTATSTTALVAREPKLGGSVAQVAVSGACGAAIVADATAVNATSLVVFDPSTGAAIAPASRSPLATDGFDLEGLSWVEGELLVGDRRRAGSGYPVHELAAGAGCALARRPDPVFLPLPPVEIRAVR